MKRFGQAITAPLRLVSQPVALVVAALLLLGAWSLVIFIQASEAGRDARNNLLLTANAIAGAADAPLVPFVEQAQAFRPADFTSDRVLTTTRLLRLQELLPGNGTTFMLDAGGRLIAASVPFTPADTNVAAAGWFHAALSGTSMSLGLQALDQPWLGISGGVLSRVVRDPSGRAVGLIGAVLPSTSLDHLAARSWLPAGVQVTWLGMDNRGVLALPAPAVPQAEHPASAWVTALMTSLGHLLSDSQVWSVTVPLQHLNAAIVATVDGEIALRGRPIIGRSAAVLGSYLLAVWLTCLALVGAVSSRRSQAVAANGFGSDWRCEIDPRGRITAMHGFAPGDLRQHVGEDLLTALKLGTDDACARQISEALAARVRLDAVTVAFPHADNAARLHRLTIEPRQDGGFACSGRDVTAQCRAEAEASAAAQSRDAAQAEASVAMQEQEQVLASLGHDIRTPMTTIMGICDLLLAGDLEHEQRAWLQRMQASGHALLGMLNGLLELTASEAERSPLQTEPVDVAALVLDVTQVLAPQARDKGLELRVRCDDRLRGEWVVDPTRLRQVLFNLVSNAVKFTSHGLVDVRAAASGDDTSRGLRFSISDTGPGINPGDRDLIFERFRRGRDPANAARPGVGLGLALSRESAGLMGGTLTLESSLGLGSEFTLSIPAERIVADDRDAPFAGRTALIVGEEDPAIPAAAVQLSEMGLVVETAPDGFVGLALAERLDAQRGALDLVVLQGKLVSMPAEVFLLRLRATAFGRRASVVWIGSGAAAGAVDAIVPAPTDPYQVAAAARQLLGARASLDALEPDAVVPRGGRILLVEDDRTAQALISTALSRRGFAVFVANNGEEAVRLAGRDSFDAILMDLQMPGMDGFAAVRLIRAAGGRGATLPILALTAFHGAKTRQLGLEAGFTAVLEKPINLDRLEATLRRWTGGTPAEAVAPMLFHPLDYDADVSLPFLEEMVAVVGLERARACVAEFVADATARCNRLEELLPGWEVQAIIRNCHEISAMAETCGAIGLQELLEELADVVARDDRAVAETLIGPLEDTVLRLPGAMGACLADIERRWPGGTTKKAA